ncbi:hypothetical protein BGX38DRAFT_1278681 [Terfezia claveryi]|nr:hypothetical protein BGX38DRAFT_1278681 [Terfezia claveryi]
MDFGQAAKIFKRRSEVILLAPVPEAPPVPPPQGPPVPPPQGPPVPPPQVEDGGSGKLRKLKMGGGGKLSKMKMGGGGKLSKSGLSLREEGVEGLGMGGIGEGGKGLGGDCRSRERGGSRE